MRELEYQSDLPGVMSAIRDAMFEWDGHLHYMNESKGVVVLSPSRVSRFAHAILIVDATEVDGR
jgi:hypothetical protein